MNNNGNDSEIDHEVNQENELMENEHQNPAEFFKVTPDDYTDSDSNTIIDFDEEEESKSQNEPKEKNADLKENQNKEMSKEEENA